jgi:hypothetical protein
MLKGFFKTHKGMSLRLKLRELKWELRYAWQRAWKGFDDTEVFELDKSFIERIVMALKEFKIHNDTRFRNYDNLNNSTLSIVDPSAWLSEEETNSVIDEMIYLFENSDADEMLQPLYGRFNTITRDFENRPTAQQMAECFAKAQENRHKGLKLFEKYFDCLWY